MAQMEAKTEKQTGYLGCQGYSEDSVSLANDATRSQLLLIRDHRVRVYV